MLKFNDENTMIVTVPNSEANQNQQIKGIKDSEVGAYYNASDNNRMILSEIEDFFDNFTTNIVVSSEGCQEFVKDIIENVFPLSFMFKGGLLEFDQLKEDFIDEDVQIGPMRFTGEDNRYLDFDRINNPKAEDFKKLILGGITTLTFTKEDDKIIVVPSLKQNYINEIVGSEKKQNILLTELTEMFRLSKIKNLEEFVRNNKEIFIILGEEITKKFKEYIDGNLGEYEEQIYDKISADLFIKEEEIVEIIELIGYSKNLIIQGPPGVGKTYVVNKIIEGILGDDKAERSTFIQFHQSYSYEDFFMGYRPDGNGFRMSYGPFYTICEKATNDKDNDYYIIIDEINRGNISSIFGDLLMIIEKGHRGEEIIPVYGEDKFSVPENLYIIGMMNTADRSLTLIDYALRRRFSFYNMKPALEEEKFIGYVKGLNSEKLSKLIKNLLLLNETINSNPNLGDGFLIGHSYLSNLEKENLNSQINIVLKYELEPLLKEYWYDNPEELKIMINLLNNSL